MIRKDNWSFEFMEIRTACLLLIGTPLAALGTGTLVNLWFRSEQQAFEAHHQRDLAEDTQQWAREEAARKVAAHEEALTRVRERQRQLEQAWGGAAEAAWKNPDLTIAQMLEQLARACAPSGTRVAVRIDRFTDFEVGLELKRDTAKPQLAEASVCLLRHATPYLRNLRFSTGGAVLAELDTQAIDSVGDWSFASSAEAEKLLTLSEGANAGVTAAASKPGDWLTDLKATMKEISAGTDERQLTGDALRLRNAQASFKQSLAVRQQRLKLVLDKQDQATRLNDVYSAQDLDTKLALLRESQVVLAEVRSSFYNEDQEYRRTLEQAQIDPLMVKIEVRGVSERQERRRPYLEQLFQALAERQRNATSLVSAMQRTWGNWSTSGNMIQFTSSDAQANYRQAIAALNQATDQVSAAMRAFGESEAAQR
jgi:hypothetical protein